jgi:hypothetical protein
MIAMAVGGTTDHVHLFLAIPPMMPVAKSVQLIKAGSSKWFRETQSRMFAWQQGYGSFSVSKSNEARVRAYIRNQAEHHRNRISSRNSKSCCAGMDSHSNRRTWNEISSRPWRDWSPLLAITQHFVLG